MANDLILYPSCKYQVNDLYITCELAERILASTIRGFPLLYTYTRAKHPLRTLLECPIQTLFLNLFLTLSFQCSCTEESLKFLWQKGGTPRYKQFHPLPQHFVCCIKSNIHNYHK